MTRTTVWLLCMTLLSGCTTMKPVKIEKPEAAPFGSVKAGDTVVVYTKDGRTDRFVVAQVVGDTIVSTNGSRYDAADVAKLERKALHIGRSIGLGVGIFFTTAIIITAIAAAAFLGSWS